MCDIKYTLLKLSNDINEKNLRRDSLLKEYRKTIMNTLLASCDEIVENKLLFDIIKKIIEYSLNGRNELSFDLQYTNPRKGWYRPGPPLHQLTEKDHIWLNNRGFYTKNIIECYNSSTSCEFGCPGDGVCTLYVKWSRVDKTDNKCFNASTCNSVSDFINECSIKKID